MKQGEKLIDLQKYILNENKKLGVGTFSTVFEGMNKQTQEKIALKAFEIKKSHIPYLNEIIEKQVQILKTISSPNIIQFYDVLISPQRAFIAQELADSQLAKEGAAHNTFQYLCQIANGLGTLIEKGIVHRNLNPESIFMKKGVLKIGNFSHSRFIKRNEFLSVQKGKKEFMCPQMLMKEKYSFKCDIWSFGVLCYQISAGSLPWKPETVAIKDYSDFKSSITKACDDGIQFPDEFNPELKELIVGCLRVEEKDRFSWHEVFHHEYFKGIFKGKYSFCGAQKSFSSLQELIVGGASPV